MNPVHFDSCWGAEIDEYESLRRVGETLEKEARAHLREMGGRAVWRRLRRQVAWGGLSWVSGWVGGRCRGNVVWDV